MRDKKLVLYAEECYLLTWIINKFFILFKKKKKLVLYFFATRQKHVILDC